MEMLVWIIPVKSVFLPNNVINNLAHKEQKEIFLRKYISRHVNQILKATFFLGSIEQYFYDVQ